MRLVTAYSSRKYAQDKRGRVTKRFDPQDPNIDQLIAEWRQTIKDDNAAFRAEPSREAQPLEPRSEAQQRSTASEPERAEQRSTASEPENIAQPLPIGPRSGRSKFRLKLDQHTGNTTCILGSSKMGKSTLMMDIYKQAYMPDKEMISILWTNNPQVKMYKKRNLIIGDTFNKEAERIIAQQKRIQSKTKNEYEFLNMFDDVLNVRHNALLDNMFLSWRNAKMSSIISLQYSNMMSKASRANCNNIILFGFNTDEAVEVVIKTYLNGWMSTVPELKHKSMAEKIQWYHSVTNGKSKHGFIYVKPQDGLVEVFRPD